MVYVGATRSMSFMRSGYILKVNVKVNLKRNLFRRCEICSFMLLVKQQHEICLEDARYVVLCFW